MALLVELAAALRSSTDALVRLDIEMIHQSVGNQERLCGEIRSLDRGLDTLQRKWAAGIAAHGEGGEIDALIERVANAQAEVRQLNQRHAALVRRSRRTLEAMLNFLRSAAPTYTDPRLVGAPAGGRS
ncbi:MAG: flagellar export chaperone FlgN [Acidobacteriota bacterium]|nr:flagellar export chaperone FlgN [Acidobacteriota bacterium]